MKRFIDTGWLRKMKNNIKYIEIRVKLCVGNCLMDICPSGHMESEQKNRRNGEGGGGTTTRGFTKGGFTTTTAKAAY